MSQNPAASRALRVLRFLAAQTAPVPATRIADAIGVPRSSMYHLLVAMQEQGFVHHVPEERRYSLGPTAFEIGTAYLRQEPLARLGRPLLVRLVQRVGLPAHLGVLHGRETLYVVEQRPRRSVPVVSDVGVRLPAHLTASGLVMLAGLPSAQVTALFPDRASFVDRTGGGVTSLTALRRLLMQVRAQRVAYEDGWVVPSVGSVAVASLDGAGRPSAAVAVSYPRREGKRPRAAVVTEVRRAADELTRRLGGRP